MSIRNRRGSVRHATTLAVKMRLGRGGRVYEGLSSDLSRSGIFVQVDAPLREGERIDLVIDPGGDTKPLMTSGIVVHALRAYGVGIRFTSQSPRTAEQLEALLERLKAREVKEDPVLIQRSSGQKVG